jgi:hypothetical protein
LVDKKRLEEVFGSLTLEHLRWDWEHLLNDPGTKNAADECVIVVMVAEWYGIGTGSIEYDNGRLLSSRFISWENNNNEVFAGFL